MLIFAHRGASAIEPENTLTAISKAIEDRADGIEFDVYQHGKEFILIHDRWLERTTNGTGSIENYSFEQLQKLDAGNGEKIPTLYQALGGISDKSHINIEVKGIQDTQLLLSYVNQATTLHQIPKENIIYSSFDHHLLREIKSLEPKTRIGALTASKPIDYSKFAADLGAEYVNVDVTFVDEAFIEDAHSRGLKFGVFTVDQSQELLQLKRWGVDMVFCNHPANARKVLNEKSPQY